jgi:hypothetical protein
MLPWPKLPFMLFVLKEMTTQESRLPALPGYEWTISRITAKKAVVLQLTLACCDSHAERNVSPVKH